MATARLLIVDDEPVTLRMACDILQTEYEVLSTSSARNALETIKSKPHIDLVLSDVQMPEMGGADLLDEIHRLSPSTAGVLMSGSEEVLSVLPPDTPFLRKPFSSNELLAAVGSVLARSRKLTAALDEKGQRAKVLAERAFEITCKVRGTIRAAAETCEKSRILRENVSGLDLPEQSAARIICANCTAELQANARVCDQCSEAVGLYSIVRDGFNFGIAVRGAVRLHGLTFNRARELVTIMNGINP
jgi:CheY-like chemotaxis protein